ncbi:MAG TPA: lipocalin-like domain-containing protein [Steroidobacteraceae bacterium]|nr:lipocalin-like domain-containing protein [Steroidobacteraceae bacterium]
MCAARYARFSLLSLIWAYALLCQASPAGGRPPPLTRQQLIGAWRLVSIDCSGPSGPIVDPFYQADSIGIIIYDASGWMSVQIAAPHRQALEVPESRLSASEAAPEARMKAAAFDTYYAYFGTWKFDAASATVSHHVESSLISSETGVDYRQHVSLESGRLVLTTRSGKKGEEMVRRKVWERITGLTE